MTQNADSPAKVAKAKDHNIVEFGKFDGVTVYMSLPEQMIEVWSLCRAGRKAWGDFRSMKSTRDYLAAVAKYLGVEQAQLITSYSTGSRHRVFVCRQVASACAMWLSPECHAWFTDRCLELARVTSPDMLPKTPVIPPAEERMVAAFGALSSKVSYMLEQAQRVVLELARTTPSVSYNGRPLPPALTDPRKIAQTDDAIRAWIKDAVNTIHGWWAHIGPDMSHSAVHHAAYALLGRRHGFNVLHNYDAYKRATGRWDAPVLDMLRDLGRDIHLAQILYDNYGERQPFVPVSVYSENRRIDLAPVDRKLGQRYAWHDALRRQPAEQDPPYAADAVAQAEGGDPSVEDIAARLETLSDGVDPGRDNAQWCDAVIDGALRPE